MLLSPSLPSVSPSSRATSLAPDHCARAGYVRHTVPGRPPCRGLVVRAAAAESSQQSFVERAVNTVTELITKSPINEGKKQFFQRLAGSYDRQEVQQKIDSLIKEHPVVVFSWTFCPFAKRAKGLLTEVGAQFTAVELDQIPDGKAVKAELGMLTNRTSVPNVFIGGKSYGGMNDGPGISKLHERGELVPLLQQAGVL